MVEMLRIAANIATPLAALGVLLLLGYYAYLAWLQSEERKLLNLPEADRAKAIDTRLSRYNIDASNLTREQKYQLISAEMAQRSKTLRFVIIGGITLFAIAAAAYVASLVIPSQPPPRAEKPAAPDEVEITDIGFSDYDGDLRAPRLDLKLANRGTRSAFVKRVELKVRRTWRLKDVPATAEVVVPPSHNYVLRLRPQEPPWSLALPVAQGLKPDDLDRFTVQIEEEEWATANTVYLADVEILANANDTATRKENVLFLVSHQVPAFHDQKKLKEIIKFQRTLGRVVDEATIKAAMRANKETALEIEKVGGVRSFGLQHLIDAAKKAPIDWYI